MKDVKDTKLEWKVNEETGVGQLVVLEQEKMVEDRSTEGAREVSWESGGWSGVKSYSPEYNIMSDQSNQTPKTNG